VKTGLLQPKGLASGSCAKFDCGQLLHGRMVTHQ
jgi:hypothetical protein